jgi:ABC-type transport system involved in multi-copper enzyme maturation permease subunit
MYRTLVIIRYTFLEATLQPIYSFLLTLGAAIVVVFGVLPFFALGDDTKMFMSVTIDIVFLVVLLAALFAASKSIYDEIEDRTMLTLMSKPVKRWEVVVGKYIGIILSAGLAIAILGTVMALSTWFRIPNDYLLNSNSLSDIMARETRDYRVMHLTGLACQLFLTWLQIDVLVAIAVALSTRFSLVVNLPTVILIYIAGNLTRFLFPIATGPLAGKPAAVKGIAQVFALLLPYLQVFDLKAWTLLSTIRVPSTAFAGDTNGVALNTIFTGMGLAALYALTYVVFALSAGLWSFQSRELGGGEG